MRATGCAAGSSPILIVDDREAGLVALRAALEPLGEPILSARSGDEALSHLLREPVAVILMDVYMPGMNGFETAELIKQRPKTRDIPIIFLTADRDAAEHGQMALGYSSGAVDFLVKPFDPRILRSKVAVFIELHRTTERLRHQVEELTVSRSALARAQRIARLAHFDIDVGSGEVGWSENVSELLGVDAGVLPPPDGLLPFLDELRSSGFTPEMTHTQAQIAIGSTTVTFAITAEPLERDGAVVAVTGTVQDITDEVETRRALAATRAALQQEHEVVALLQKSMLPADVPQPPGLDIAVRYLPADVGIGGDWYDVTWRRDGYLMLVIGDVAGHGLAAAATMNELRIAARAFALRDSAPSRVLAELNRYVDAMPQRVLATALIVMLDPVTGRATAASAGHLPPVVEADEPVLLPLTVGPPLGAGLFSPVDTEFVLAPGDRMLLYTDGLVEMPSTVIDARLETLRREVTESTKSADDLAERVITRMLADGRRRDDVAVLAVQRDAQVGLSVSGPAEPSRMSMFRATLQRWLESVDATPEETSDLVLAAGELLANVCVHAHPFGAGLMRLNAGIDGERVARISVTDTGAWRERRERGGGRGLSIVRAVVDDLAIDSDETGTTATVSRRLGAA